MISILSGRVDKPRQYVLSVLLVCLVAVACYPFTAFTGYKVVAYLLLISVSLLAMLFDIFPVLVAATLSAFIWDFFFIPPYFTLQIGSAEDTFLLLMYFVIVLVNAALTYKIRAVEKQARIKEEKANSVKLYNTLLNSLSHELKTPIATIIGATDNLQASGNHLTAKDRHDLVVEISKASFRLNQQVENLLNMSRLEAGFLKVKNDWCDVNELIYDTVNRFEENKVSQQFSISINPDLPLFKTDKMMLEQVVYNLLNNAVQYTPPSTKINISATANADLLRIIIEDNGQGFPEQEIDRVFEKFYRLKDSITGGTGLGLSIVKGFTEALSGDVSLENVKAGGARFTIQIQAQTSYLKNLKNE